VVVDVGLTLVLGVEVLVGDVSVTEGGVIMIVVVLRGEVLEATGAHVVGHVVVTVAVGQRLMVVVLKVIRHERVPTQWSCPANPGPGARQAGKRNQFVGSGRLTPG
jgi:hypothetical protein